VGRPDEMHLFIASTYKRYGLWPVDWYGFPFAGSAMEVLGRLVADCEIIPSFILEENLAS
jgi:hypothetical protein